MGVSDDNLAKLRAARAEAAEGGQTVVTSELFVSGYPPEDLILKPLFIEQVIAAVKNFAIETADGGPAILLGTPWRADGEVINAVVLLEDGAVTAVQAKVDLPNLPGVRRKRVRRRRHAGTDQFQRGAHRRADLRDVWSPDVVQCLQDRAPR